MRLFPQSCRVPIPKRALHQTRWHSSEYHDSTLRLPLEHQFFKTLASHDLSRPAIVHSSSQNRFFYGQLLSDTRKALGSIQNAREGSRVAILGKNNYDFVVALLASLANGSIAVPLSPSFPAKELGYMIENSDATICQAAIEYEGLLRQAMKAGEKPTHREIAALHQFTAQNNVPVGTETTLKAVDDIGIRAGLMIYTSGTTNRPKGVFHTLDGITAQCQSLIEAWEYTPTDHLLHALPLNHIHGLINGLFAPLMSGATIEFLFPFNAKQVWERLAAPLAQTNRHPTPVSIFTAVPTMYDKLLSSHSELSPEVQSAAKLAIQPQNLRLNMSGSAALPSTIRSGWSKLSSGNVLLERYGMTEAGMALSCGLAFDDRIDGSVGWPLPGVEARLVDPETGETILPSNKVGENTEAERQGEIQLRGPTIFKEYWQNAGATHSEFVTDQATGLKWFRTGDIAVQREVSGTGLSSMRWAKGPMYFIKGRKSIDIIKSGGEKISALEIERELLSLPEISEAAVVGIDSAQWGQAVAAVVVLRQETVSSKTNRKPWSVLDMRKALKDRLARHKIPIKLKVVSGLPRNAMGKVNKASLVREHFTDDSTSG